MNIKLYITALIIAIGFVSCKDESIGGDFSDVTWTNTLTSHAIVEKGDFASFMDLSQGALSHEWTISNGNYFMSDDFSRQDTNLYDFILPEMGLSTNDEIIHVLFDSIGIQKVRLYNTFSEEVTFNGNDTLTAIEKDGIWVIDTTFFVDVYGDMEPAFKIYKSILNEEGNITDWEEVLEVLASDNPETTDSINWPVLDIEAGESLKFVDLTTIDRPEGRTWRIHNGNSYENLTDSVCIINYLKLGALPQLLGTMRSEREGDEHIPRSNVSKQIPLHVNVVPSTKPLIIDGDILQNLDGSISFKVNGLLNPFSNQEGEFKVYVTNAASGFDNFIEVKSAKVSKKDNSVIDLELDSRIYNSDVVTVSYTGNGIESTDYRILENFEDVTVKPYYFEGIDLEFGGFEILNPSANAMSASAQGWWMNGSNIDIDDQSWIFKRVESDEFSQVIGEASMRVKGTYPSGNCRIDYTFLDMDKMPAGSYRLSFMIYIKQGSGMDELQIQTANPNSNLTFIDVSESIVPRDTWVKITEDVVIPSDLVSDKVKLRINPKTGNFEGHQEWYMDSFSWINIEERP